MPAMHMTALALTRQGYGPSYNTGAGASAGAVTPRSTSAAGTVCTETGKRAHAAKAYEEPPRKHPRVSGMGPVEIPNEIGDILDGLHPDDDADRDIIVDLESDEIGDAVRASSPRGLVPVAHN